MPGTTGHVVFDQAWRVRRIDGAARGLLGLTGRASELAGLPLRAVVPGDEPPPERLPCSRYRAHLLSDGNRRALLEHFRPVDGGVAVDIDPPGAMWEFAEQLQVPVAATDERGWIVFANRAVGEMLGVPSESLIGQDAALIAQAIAVRPEDVGIVLAAALEDDGALADAFWIHPPAGGRRRIRVHCFGWRHRGLRCGAIWTIVDFTEAEDARNEAVKAVWYRQAALFQHELRNPLQTLQAAAEVLRPLVHAEGDHLLNLLQQQVRLISEYLTDQLQPPQEAALAAGRLSDVVQAEIERSALRFTTGGLTFDHVRPQDEPGVRLHAGSMGRVFANLFRNSAQARFDAHLVIRYTASGEHLACTVTDDGPGFSGATHHGALLLTDGDPTEHLGLMVVKSAIEAHGGIVTVGNEPGGGASVTIRLPVTAAHVLTA